MRLGEVLYRDIYNMLVSLWVSLLGLDDSKTKITSINDSDVGLLRFTNLRLVACRWFSVSSVVSKIFRVSRDSPFVTSDLEGFISHKLSRSKVSLSFVPLYKDCDPWSQEKVRKRSTIWCIFFWTFRVLLKTIRVLLCFKL